MFQTHFLKNENSYLRGFFCRSLALYVVSIKECLIFHERAGYDGAHTIDEPLSNEGAVIIACWKSREFPETDSFNLL